MHIHGLLALCLALGCTGKHDDDTGGTADGGGTGDGGTGDGGDTTDGDGDGVSTPEDCDDADALVYPGAPTVCGDGRVNDCDGTEADEAAACLRAATVVGSETYGSIGLQQVTGDLDGDGQADLLLADARVDGAGTNDGMLFLFRGPVRGDLSSEDADLLLAGAAGASGGAGSRLGAWDVDGDGQLDLLVGAPGVDGDGIGDVAVAGKAQPSGSSYSYQRVHLHLGPIAEDRAVDDADAEINLGWLAVLSVVAMGGDMDGDGLGDLAAGAPEYGEGDVRLFTSPLVGSLSYLDADTTLSASTGDSMVGGALDFAGDLDLDGKQDLVVAAGACSADEGGTSCAKAEAHDAWIFLDPVAGGAREMDEAAIVLEGDHGTGNALATGHDITGDGLLDVVVGRFSHDYDPYINEALVFSPGGI